MGKNIEHEVRRIVAAYLEKRGITSVPGNTDSLINGGFIDSMGTMEIISALEATFKITILPEEMTEEYFDSIDKLAGFVASKEKK